MGEETRKVRFVPGELPPGNFNLPEPCPDCARLRALLGEAKPYVATCYGLGSSETMRDEQIANELDDRIEKALERSKKRLGKRVSDRLKKTDDVLEHPVVKALIEERDSFRRENEALRKTLWNAKRFLVYLYPEARSNWPDGALKALNDLTQQIRDVLEETQMSIADDIAKVMELQLLLAKGYAGRVEAESAVFAAPRLAAWAQQVMPLVEAAERYKQSINDDKCSTYQRMVARDGFVAAAMQLNLEVPS